MEIKKILNQEIKVGQALISMILFGGVISLIDFIKPKTDLIDTIGLFFIGFSIYILMIYYKEE